MSASTPASYPPDVHLVRDLAPVVERGPDGSAILLPIVPEILDAAGRPRVGVIATIVDIIGGESAIREVLPQWVATSSLSLHVRQLPSTGTLRARPRVLRQGRTTLVMEVDVDHVESGDPVGLSTLAFSILPQRNTTQARVEWAEAPQPRSTFATEGSGFEKPLLDKLGFAPDGSDPAIARMPVQPYVINTLGAMQGGAVATLMDAAADQYASHAFGAPAQVRGLEIHYLKLARQGPVRAEVRKLGETGSGQLVRVSLFDEGADDVLLTVATVIVDRSAT